MTASGVEISIFEPDREKTTRMKKLTIAVLTILALFISSSCGRRETELSSDDTEGTVHIDSTINDSTINDSTTDETTIKDTTANDTTVPESTESSDIPETTAETITSEPGTASDNLKIASVLLTTELPVFLRFRVSSNHGLLQETLFRKLKIAI